jgi:hypothetical protein
MQSGRYLGWGVVSMLTQIVSSTYSREIKALVTLKVRFNCFSATLKRFLFKYIANF